MSESMTPIGSAAHLRPRNCIGVFSGFSLTLVIFQMLYSVSNPWVFATSFLMNSFARNATATMSMILMRFEIQYDATKVVLLSSNPNASATTIIEIASAFISCFVKKLIVLPSVFFVLCFPRGQRLPLPRFPYLSQYSSVYIKLLPYAHLFPAQGPCGRSDSFS